MKALATRRTFPPKIPDDRCLRTKALLEYCGGIGRSTLHKWRHKRNFPKPIEISTHLKVWRKNEVDTWLASHRSAA